MKKLVASDNWRNPGILASRILAVSMLVIVALLPLALFLQSGSPGINAAEASPLQGSGTLEQSLDGILYKDERLMTIENSEAPRGLSRYLQAAYSTLQQQSNVASVLAVDSLAPGWEYRIEITEFDVEMPGLPAALDGLRLAHITDLHVGWFVTPADVSRMAALVAGLNPDLIVLTGDLVFHHESQKMLERALEPIAAINARYGAYATLGNHDYWDGVRTVERALSATGIRLLRNQAVEAAPALWVAGVEDLLAGDVDTRAALSAVPDGAPAILLSHNPNILPQVANRPLLVLAGHSHGGQVILPGQSFEDDRGPNLYARLMTAFETVGFLRRGGNRAGLGTWRYVNGWYSEGQARMYVGRGLGMVRPPVRINCPAELTLIRLKSR